VEVVQAAFDAWNAGDMDRLRDMYDPNVVMQTVPDWPEPGPYVGRDAVMRQWGQMRATWDADAIELISDFIDSGDRVAVRLIWRGVGHGPESNIELTNLFTVRKGRIFYFEFFWDHAEALEALGLEDQAVSENLDLVRSMYAAWERGDYSATEWAHPEIEYIIADGPAPGSWSGLAGMAEGWRDFLGAWQEYRSEVEEYRVIDDERVLVLVRARARGKTSGMDVEQMRWLGASVFHLRDAKVTRFVIYFDRDRALADLGLEG